MDKKNILLGTALRLFVENGFHGTSTAVIAKEANVATGTLFNYFRTKEELIHSLYYAVLKQKDDFITDGMLSNSVSKESFRTHFEVTLSWSLDNPIHYKYLKQFCYSPFSKAVTKIDLENQSLFNLIQTGIDLILIKQLPVEFVYSLFTAQIDGLLDYIISTGITKDKQTEFIEESFEMFWKMIED